MSIDQFLINCRLEYCIEYQKHIQAQKPTELAIFYAVKKLDSYVYTKLAGDRNKSIRQKIVEKITGQKTPYYKSGVHELQKMIINQIKN
jgi:IS1 family transposase